MPRKRKRPSSKRFKERHPRLVGHFYRIIDKKGGHPGLVYYADPANDIYYVFDFLPKNAREEFVYQMILIQMKTKNSGWSRSP